MIILESLISNPRNYEVYVETRPVLRSSISSATVGTDHIGAVTCFSTSIKVQGKVRVVQERILLNLIAHPPTKKLTEFKRFVQAKQTFKVAKIITKPRTMNNQYAQHTPW